MSDLIGKNKRTFETLANLTIEDDSKTIYSEKRDKACLMY